MSRVLVLGRNGQVANELFAREGANPSFKFLSRDEIPSKDLGALEKTIEIFAPSVIVNCAAYTAVDRAESESEEAFLLNRDLVTAVARASSLANAHLVHFSTDYVFDGTSKRPYVETDETNPLGVYGTSKLAGERSVQEFAKSATILRTSWLFSRFGANFVKTVVRLANGEKPLRVVDDQHGTPTAAGDLADFVLDKVIPRAGRSGVEIYNFSGAGETTWNGFAREVAVVWQTRQREIVKIPTSDFPTPAKRPMYSVLSKEKLKRDFNCELLDWREALRKRYWGNE